MNNIYNKTVAVLGLAFNSETDDIRCLNSRTMIKFIKI